MAVVRRLRLGYSQLQVGAQTADPRTTTLKMNNGLKNLLDILTWVQPLCTQSRPVDPIVSNGDAQRGSLRWHCENGVCVWRAMCFPAPSMFQVNWKAKGLLTIQMDPSIKGKCFPEGRAITCKRYWWLPHNELYQWLLIENRLEFSLSLHVPACLMFAF